MRVRSFCPNPPYLNIPSILTISYKSAATVKARLSDAAFLQLLFDLKFLFYVTGLPEHKEKEGTGGGAHITDATSTSSLHNLKIAPSSSASSQPPSKQLQGLLALVESLIDPIDYALAAPILANK